MGLKVHRHEDGCALRTTDRRSTTSRRTRSPGRGVSPVSRHPARESDRGNKTPGPERGEVRTWLWLAVEHRNIAMHEEKRAKRA